MSNRPSGKTRREPLHPGVRRHFQFAELVRIRAQHDRFQALMATPALSASLAAGSAPVCGRTARQALRAAQQNPNN